MSPADPLLKILSVEPGSEKTNNMIFARRQNDALSKRGITCKSVAVAHARTLSDFVGHLLFLHREMREFKPSIVHAQYGTYNAFLCSFFSLRCKFVISFRGSDLNLEANIGNTNFLRGLLGHFLSQASALFAHRIICVSQRLAGKLWWGRSKTSVIPDGVDLASFVSGSLQEARVRIGVPEDARVLFFNAGYNPRVKRKDLSDAVAEILQSRIQGFQYLVMEGQIAPEEVPAFLQASDCLLITSDNEGSPCIVKEALACELPIVSVDVGDVSQMVQGVSQCCVEERNVKVLADRVEEIIRLGIRSDGRKFSHRYDMDRCIDRLIGVYLCLVGDQ